MFPKAAIKRYYDNVSVGPGPWTYDPKLDNSLGKGNVSLNGQSQRFLEVSSEATPGPGAYSVSKEAKNSFYKSVNRSNVSRIPIIKSVSATKLNHHDSSVFKTPPPKIMHNKDVRAFIRRSGSTSQLDDRIKEKNEDNHELNSLKSKVQEMDSNMTKVMEDNNSLISENQDLQVRYNEINMDLASTLSEKLTLESKCASLEQNFRTMSAESESSMSLLNELSEKLKEQTKKAVDYEKLLTENVTKLEEWDRLMNEMKSEKEELEMKKSSLEGSLSALRDELSSCQLENETELKELKEGIAEKEKIIEEFIESKRDLNETCLILENRLKEAETRVEELKDSESLQLELQSVNQDLTKALADLESKYLDKVKSITELENFKKSAETEAEAQRAEITNLKKKTESNDENWKAKYEALLKRFEESEANVEKLKSELSQKKQKLSKFEQTTKEDVASKSRCNLLTDMVSSLKKELAEANAKLTSKTEESDNYLKQYEALKTKIAPFRDQLEQYELEKNALLSQNQEAQGEMRKVAEALGQKLGHQNPKQKIQIMVRLKQENVDLKLALRKAETEVAHLKKKIGSSENNPLADPKNPRNLSLASPLRNSNRNIKH